MRSLYAPTASLQNIIPTAASTNMESAPHLEQFSPIPPSQTQEGLVARQEPVVEARELESLQVEVQVELPQKEEDLLLEDKSQTSNMNTVAVTGKEVAKKEEKPNIIMSSASGVPSVVVGAQSVTSLASSLDKKVSSPCEYTNAKGKLISGDC